MILDCHALPVPVFLHLSKQWILLYGWTGCPPHNETWKEFVSNTPCFFFLFRSHFLSLILHVQPVLQRFGYKNSLFKWHTLSILVVSTTTTLQRSQLMSPPPSPSVCPGEKNSWPFDTVVSVVMVPGNGDDTDVHAVFWSCMSMASLVWHSRQISFRGSDVNQLFINIELFRLIFFPSFSMFSLLSSSQSWVFFVCSSCVFLLKGSIPPHFKAC